MTVASTASQFMPGAGIADAPNSFREGWENIKEGNYTKGGVNYAVGAFDAASDMFPLTAAIPPIGAMMRKSGQPLEKLKWEVPNHGFIDSKFADDPNEPYVTLFHGTNDKNFDGIAKEGLSKIDNRTGYVSLAPDPNTANGYAAMSGVGGESEFRRAGRKAVNAPQEERSVIVMRIPKWWLRENSDPNLRGNIGIGKDTLTDKSKYDEWKKNNPNQPDSNYYMTSEIRTKPVPRDFIVGYMKKGDKNGNVYDQTEELLGIKAYHGSPADFDKFRWDDEVRSKGLGAQVKGDGLYFAENESVAQSAKRGSGFFNNKIEIVDKSTGKLIDPSTPGYKTVFNLYSTYMGDVRSSDVQHYVDKSKRSVEDYTYKIREFEDWKDNIAKTAEDIMWADEEILNLQNLREEHMAAIDLLPKTKGRAVGTMYEVKIATSKDKLLDLDKSYKDQSDHVKNGMKKTSEYILDSLQAEENIDALAEIGPTLSRIISDNSKESSLEFLYTLEEAIDRLSTYRKQEFGSTNKNQVSSLLKQQGIDGSQFLDSLHSSGKNFVIFDPELIKIVRKYGIATLVGTGLLSETLAQKLEENGIDKEGEK